MSNLPPDFYVTHCHDDRCATLCDDVNCEHDDHACTCDELAERDAENEADAYAEYLYDREP